MSWDEWERAKTAAAQGETRMRLNQLPGDLGGGPGPASDRLKSERKVWAKAGGDVKGLKSDIAKAVTTLDDGQSGLGSGEGCDSAAAQKELHASWKKYAEAVSDRCGALGGLLEHAGHDLSMTDSDVEAGLDKIRAGYRDTEPTGGQSRGR